LKQYAGGLDELERDIERLSPGVQLLLACKDIFARCGDEFIATQTLIAYLLERSDEPWADYRNGKPINERNLRDLLHEFDIKPERDKTRSKRGYYRAAFRDAWSRYANGKADSPINPSDASDPSDASGRQQGNSANGRSLPVLSRPSTKRGGQQ
jgi:hypothetical protein